MHNIFAGPMGIKSQSKKHCKEKRKKVQVSRKQFGTNGVNMRVKREGLLAVLYVQHMID